MDDDDYFASDDLNDLGEDDFQALEDAAVLASTQRQASQSAPSKPPWSGRAGIPRAQQILTGNDQSRAVNFQNQGKRRDYHQEYPKQQHQQKQQQAGGSQDHWNPHVESQSYHPQQESTSEYVTVLPNPNIPYRHDYDNQPQVTYTNSVQNIPQVDTAEPDEYGDFDTGVELWDDAQPTAVEPQHQLPSRELDYAEPQAKADYYYNNGDGNHGDHNLANGNEDAIMEMGHNEQVQQRGEEAEDIYAMKLRMQELMSQNRELAKHVDDLKDRVITKAGESAILRAKMLKTKSAHETALASFHAMQSEEREAYKRELEAARSDVEKSKTDNVFLKKEIEEVALKNKLLEKGRKATLTLSKSDKNKSSTDLTSTPKKNKAYNYRDGFDDDELVINMATSPSKSVGYRDSPSRSGKRKRRDDTLVTAFSQQLPMSQGKAPSPPPQQDAETITGDNEAHLVDEALLDKLSLTDKRFEYYQAITSYTRPDDDIPILERLSSHVFSDEGITPATMFSEFISNTSTTGKPVDFAASVCTALLSLWERCYLKVFFDPLNLILDLLNFAISYNVNGNAIPIILDQLVDLVQRTVAHVLVLRNDKEDTSINITKCLLLLDRVAHAAVGDDTLLRRFWRTLPYNCTKRLLDLNRNINHIKLMTQILTTSSRYESFGNHVDDENDQRRNERQLLEAIGKLFYDSPKFDPDTPENKQRTSLLDMRIGLVVLLGAIATNKIGIQMIWNYPPTIWRLSHRLSDELDNVYSFKYGTEKRYFPLCFRIPQTRAKAFLADMANSIKLINIGIRLMHGIIVLQDSGEVLQSLMTSPKAYRHKHLVLLTRLAFMEEGSMLTDLGVEEDTISAARDLLSVSTTADEADELWDMFNVADA